MFIVNMGDYKFKFVEFTTFRILSFMSRDIIYRPFSFSPGEEKKISLSSQPTHHQPSSTYKSLK